MARAAAKFSEVIALLQRNTLEERGARRARRGAGHHAPAAHGARCPAARRDDAVPGRAPRHEHLDHEQRHHHTPLLRWYSQEPCAVRAWTAQREFLRPVRVPYNRMTVARLNKVLIAGCHSWGCISHRHHCPLFVLLYNAQCSPDAELQRIAAAALLAFSVQNECQLQLDVVSGIPVLLELLDFNGADVRVYAAATMWNMCKSPLLMLKLETIHGILKDRLARTLTDILTTPLEPFQLSIKPTGERGISGIIESDSPENINLLLSSSINTQLSIALHVENYTGHPRPLTDQFSVNAAGKPNRAVKSNSKTVAHFDKRGVLMSRTCAVCAKAIKVNRKSARGTFLLCARDECGQTYHIKCSRWATLGEDDIRPEHFHCDTCMALLPLYYWDFVAENEQYSELLSENLFKSVAITRVSAAPLTSYESEANPFQLASAAAQEPLAMLFNREQQLLGVGKRLFRIPKSSKDDEMFVVSIRFTTALAYPATQQVLVASRTHHRDGAAASNSDASRDPEDLRCDWEVSYASDDASSIDFEVGSAMFWPGTYLLDISPLGYTEKRLEDLESAWIYEFQGEQPTDKMYSFGASPSSVAVNPTSSSTATSKSATRAGIWTALYPRKGVCMKVLAEQIGRAKQREAARAVTPSTDANSVVAKPPGTAPSGSRKKKPHFAGQKLNKVAVSSM